MSWFVYEVMGTVYRISGTRAEFYARDTWYVAGVSASAISGFHLARLVAKNVVFK